METAQSKESTAKTNFATLCKTLDNMHWKFQRDDEKLVVTTTAVGQDLTIKLRVVVDAARQVMFVKSPMPYNVPQSSRELIGKAVHVANFSMLNGCFEYGMSEGYIGFKMVIPFEETVLSEKVCKYMILLTCQMVDKFNDKFLSLAKGALSFADFCAFTNGSN